ncbi:hypothetical protein [Natrarchaeobaculum sulfurireducens]|uniref:Uncharacterized protein n=1 Tax=Natrarchaeobaculum sulfurireducens TaxID=2044521 RepID=A0A346PPF5_9EURY|nr:hypothetical protein [Natrarchaeobaculum sulfurireducens]AXR78548.1 hypothetical protein AArc1_2232 [Natrarchaeobaculum sulfurireducens]AXR81400.1 hypothetical protein AArcMg_1385 [Natrarchaeobaculum sulfurireducens]
MTGSSELEDVTEDSNEGATRSPRLLEQVGEGLETVRSDGRAHALALGVAIVVGLGLASLHWVGLIVAGALVGLVSPTLGRAVAGAIGVGLIVLLTFAVSLGGAIGPALAMTPVSYLVAAAGIGLPIFGSLVRGIV